jgi:hypothetical protein
MVRRTIEGTCKEQGTEKPNLMQSIAELQTRGLIDGTLADWANALRILGNEAAHYTGQPIGREDAQDSLAFAEALLDNVYVLRKRFRDFETRVAERKAKKEPGPPSQTPPTEAP